MKMVMVFICGLVIGAAALHLSEAVGVVTAYQVPEQEFLSQAALRIGKTTMKIVQLKDENAALSNELVRLKAQSADSAVTSVLEFQR